MLRLLLIGVMLTGFGFGLQRGWFELRGDRIQHDIGLLVDQVLHPGPTAADSPARQFK